MGKEVTAVLFDFFGVIYADPLKAWMGRHGYNMEGRIAETARLLDTGVITYDEYVRRLAVVSGEEPTDLDAQFRSSIHLNEPVVATIEALKPNYRVGLLSNTCHQEIDPLLAGHGLDRLFDITVISADTGLAKPDPKIFTLALGELGATPVHTVFVDDSKANIDSAHSLVMHTVLFKDVAQLHKAFGRLDMGMGVNGAIQ